MKVYDIVACIVPLDSREDEDAEGESVQLIVTDKSKRLALRQLQNYLSTRSREVIYRINSVHIAKRKSSKN